MQIVRGLRLGSDESCITRPVSAVTMILIYRLNLFTLSFIFRLANIDVVFSLFQVLTSGSFELRIKSFTNSLGRLSSGQCCDGSLNSDAPCLAPCRTKFRVCLKIYQANIDTTSPCTFGDITTPVLGGNSLDVPNLNVEGFSNPIVFPFDFTWPVSFYLCLLLLKLTSMSVLSSHSILTNNSSSIS